MPQQAVIWLAVEHTQYLFIERENSMVMHDTLVCLRVCNFPIGSFKGNELVQFSLLYVLFWEELF